MSPENLRYGGGVQATVLNPAVAVIMILAGILILVLPHRRVIIPFLLTSILIPADQILVIGGLHFPVLRVLILFGILRLVIARIQGDSIFSGGLNKLDVAMILFTITTAVAGILLFRTGQAAIFQFGELYSTFGVYFLLRCLIRDQEDIVRSIRILGFIMVVLAAVMVCEQLTKGWNPYNLLGGARGAWSMERDGIVRAMGAFQQPIIAGTFGAVAVPLFIGLWAKDSRYRMIALVGIVAATIVTITAHSSTCLSAWLAGVFGFCLWPVRSMTRLFRWGIVVILIALQMVMKAPVWNLIARLDLSGGSSSWHRYYLIDTCIRHFWDWWLVGTASNANWGWDMWDTANQYVSYAYRSGALGLALFIAVIVYGYKYSGWARQAAPNKNDQLFLWSLSAALFAYTMAFIGISLWDQSIVEWYLLLAMIGAIAVPRGQTAQQPDSVAETKPVLSSTQPIYGVPDAPAVQRRRSLTAQRQILSHRRPTG